MKLQVVKGTTSKLLQVFIQDSSSAVGAGLTGLVFNTASLTAYYYREGAATATAITLATMTLGTWATGGFIVVDGTNMPGVYQLGIPDAALVTGANSVIVLLKGATNMAPLLLEFQLQNADPYDGVRGGLTALPNAAAAATGGLACLVAHGGTAQAGAAGTITLAAGASATDNLYRGEEVGIVGGTGVGQSRVVTAYVGATKVATVDENWITNPDNTSVYEIRGSRTPKLNSSGEVVAASVTGAVGSVTGAVGSVTGAVGSVTGNVTGSVGSVASGGITSGSFATAAITAAAIAADAIGASELAADAVTEIQAAVAAGSVASVVGAVGSVTGNVGGNVTGSVGSVASGGIAAASFAAAAITAAAIATDAIGAAELAADAVAEIQAGLATSAALATVQADTDDIQTRLPAALVSGRLDASVGAMAANTLTAAALATDAVTEIQTAVAAGAVASVTGAVGSVTGNVGGNVTGSVGSLGATAKTDVKTQVTDALAVDTYAEVAAVPAATSTIANRLGWLFAKSRNKITQTGTTQLVRNDADAGTIGTSTDSDDATTAIRGKFS